LFAAVAPLAGPLNAGPYDFDPRGNRLGNADSFGYARLFRELGLLEAADGRELPVHLVFDTDPRRAPGAFGPYWHLPLLRSKVVRYGRYKLYWDGPDGSRRFFVLDRSADARRGEKVFRHQGREWRATLDRRGRITVESAEREGWSFVYDGGRLFEFRPGAGAATYRMRWSNRELPLYLTDLSTNRRVLEIEYRGATEPERVVIGDGVVDVAMGGGAAFAPDGRTPYRDHRVSFLRELRMGDGAAETFEYEKERVRPKTLPGRAAAKAGKNLLKGVRDIAVNRMVARSGEREDFVEWEARSGFLTADFGADYAVRNRSWDPLHPEADTGAVAPDSVHLTRTPESGEEAVWGYNWKSGVRTHTDAATGEVFRNLYILAGGPANMKLRKREKRAGDGWELVERRSYDPSGRLIRMRRGGFLRSVQYDDSGTRILREFEGGVQQREVVRKGGTISRKTLFENGRPETVVFYDDQGLRRLVRSSDGKSREYRRDSSGLVVALYLNDRLHYTVRHSRNGLFREQTILDEEGIPQRKFHEALNERGRVVGRRVEELTGTHPIQIQKYVYDENNRLVDVIRSTEEEK